MARSQIIKDIASGNMDVTISLKRLKVLLSNFSKPEIDEWINAELTGYTENMKVPDYRRIKGQVKGNYFIGYMNYTNFAIPLTTLTIEERKLFETTTLTQSIGSIVDGINDEKNKNFCKTIPDMFFALLLKSSNIDVILNAHTEFSRSQFINIITIIDSKILDILLVLEKEFDNLDDLDINLDSKTPENLIVVENKIIQIIFDNSINIGDNNKITDSEISVQKGDLE